MTKRTGAGATGAAESGAMLATGRSSDALADDLVDAAFLGQVLAATAERGVEADDAGDEQSRGDKNKAGSQSAPGIDVTESMHHQ